MWKEVNGKLNEYCMNIIIIKDFSEFLKYTTL